MSSSDSHFRAIVVGGGVTGLVASHCLQKAGIDHVVLERRDDVAPPEGASIGMYPHGCRILHQIGCLEAAQKSCVPMGRWLVRGPDGQMIMNNGYFRHLKRNHGTDLLLLERRQFLQLLYDNLPDKSYIKTSARIKDIKHVDDGVEVELGNGEVEKGDIVIGCDGVYSATRSFMWEHAGKVTPGLITVDEKKRIKTEWKSLLGVSPAIPELGERDLTVLSDKGNTFLGIAQPDQCYFFYIFHTDEKFSWPKRVTYTDEDADALAANFADHAITDSMTFGELWRKRTRGGLINLEEGILDHWHSGRIVLAGDAAHKVTPNIALGGNSGMESVAALCNQLNRLLKESGGQKPSSEALSRAFDEYQARRIPRMQEICSLSGLITRVHAWDSPLHKFLSNWVFPLQSDTSMATLMGKIIQGGEKLDYVDDSDFPSGKLAWKDKVEPSHQSPAIPKSLAVRTLGGMAALLLVLQGFRFLTFVSATKMSA